MISKRIKGRKDAKSSAGDALRYGEGLKIDRATGEYLDKSHRTRLGGFGLVDDGVYSDLGIEVMTEIIDLASVEMQANCDLNTRVGNAMRIAHFVISYDQDKPSEAVLRDTEDSMLSAMKLDDNHFATFLHNDNGYWHLHVFASRIGKDKPHNGNSLWNDQTIRDKVCREIEIRHDLKRDNGMHEIDQAGLIVEIPLVERRAKRKEKNALDPKISDRAKTAEVHSGEKSFQAWANEIRIGDRLKHAKSWKEIHATAAAYNCEIKQKGAGLVICPIGETGGMQLSKIGLKNLPAKYGAFLPASSLHQEQAEAAYKPVPTQVKGVSHYEQWRKASNAFQPVKTDRLNEQREANKAARKEIVAQQKSELARIKASVSGQERIVALSIAKMQQTVALAELTAKLAGERQALRRQLAAQGPGSTFRDYLVIQASKGDDVALGLARKYGVDASTEVLRISQADELKIVATVSGQAYRPALRLNFTHRIERNGTVVYDFGQGRKVTDSAVSKQVQLNAAASNSPEAIATALSFATTKFGNTLTLTGSPEFQRLAVETAVRKGLNINFQDPALQEYKHEFTAAVRYASRTRYLTPQQIEKGIAHVLPKNGRPPAHILARSPSVGRPPEHVLRAQQHTQGAAAEGAGSLHELPAGRLDGEGQLDRGVLPNLVYGGVGNGPAGKDQDVRGSRTGSHGGGSGATNADIADAKRPGAAGAESRVKRPGRIVRPVIDGELDGAASERIGISVAGESTSATHMPEDRSAHTWLAAWAAVEHKTVTGASPGNGAVGYKVLFIGTDGVALNKGRSGAVYPIPIGLELTIGMKVYIDKNSQIHIPNEVEGGKGGRGK